MMITVREYSAPRITIPTMTKPRLSGSWKTYDGPTKKHPTEAISRPIIIIFLFDIQA